MPIFLGERGLFSEPPGYFRDAEVACSNHVAPTLLCLFCPFGRLSAGFELSN